ncbi:MAG: DUF2793 domain-containing protein [Rhodobacter sp.]|nr:DUF2793 domain-containing protein [Rhodobacter sp.]
MSETTNLGLPLLQASQAQKHVTVNESLAKLDGLTHLTLSSLVIATPPGAAEDGEAYGVPIGAVNEWNGHVGEIAIRSNGGWVFVAPQIGWRAWIGDAGAPALYTGEVWEIGGVTMSANMSVAALRISEFDHVVPAGTTSTIPGVLPLDVTIFSVAGVVKSAISGTLTSWKLGISNDPDRYGTGLGLIQGASFKGTNNRTFAYDSDKPLVMTAIDGDFAGGEVRFAVHYLDCIAPSV